jgi:Fe-S-cluster containining protein
MSEAPSRRSLPLLPGAGHLDFHCNGCGNCCRSLRVAITHHDLERLVGGLGRHPSSLVEWLEPDAVDMTGEPGSFVELNVGRRLMVLAHREGACWLLDGSQRCTAYEFRPRDCRLFPFDLARDDTGTLVRIDRLALEGCGDERGEPADIDELASSDERRWAELVDYQARVARWNRTSRHRRRFRQRVGDADEFIAFLGRGGPPLPTDPARPTIVPDA